MKHLFLIILIPALLLIGGCASMSKPTVAPLEVEHAGAAIVGFGTLASFGTFEMDLAPVYTRNAVARHNAARALRNKQITADEAREILSWTDDARFLLDKAHAASIDGKETPDAREYLNQALGIVESTERRLP